MKKILAIALSAVMVALSAVSVSATTAPTATSETKHYNFITTETIPNNTLRLYRYGNNIDSTARVSLKDYATSKTTTVNISETGTPVSASFPSTAGYELYAYSQCGGGNYNRTVRFNNTGGTYDVVKLKLSDFSTYFNEDGTYTKTFSDDTHNYNFTDEGNGYYSHLLIISGGAMTFAAPDSDGYVVIYVSRKINEGVRFLTDFSKVTSTSISCGGGISGERLKGLAVGDVNTNNYVSIDDATTIQKYIADTVTLDSLSKRNADVNHDGKINVMDSTELQKYLVES